MEISAKFDFDQGVNFSDREEVIKFSHSSQSRQREEAGARETPSEISPDRPQSSFLTEQQRMTSFTGKIPSSEGHKKDALEAPHILNFYPASSTASPDSKLGKLAKSPLKPSNESLLDHYKYEKQSKGSSGHHSLSDLYTRGEGVLGEGILSQHNNNSSSKKQ